MEMVHKDYLRRMTVIVAPAVAPRIASIIIVRFIGFVNAKIARNSLTQTI